MTKDQWEVVSTAQIQMQQLATVLRLVGHAQSDGSLVVDALEACATMALDIAERIDNCPGYADAGRRG